MSAEELFYKRKYFDFEGESLPYTELYLGNELCYVVFLYRGNVLIYKYREHMVIKSRLNTITLHEYHVFSSFLWYMYRVN